MKNFLILLVSFILFTTGIGLAYAYPIGDPDDIFYVNAPGANQKVSGTVNISWRMWDDDQSSIQYTAKLYDAATCENVNYGTINANLNGVSNKDQDNTLAWNTNNTQTSTNLPDGNYCLQICAAMRNGAASYSACNSRIVRIVNHNSLPVITSNPSNLTIKESDSWSYQVTAYDSDNDPLVYSLVYSTNFLEINTQTGLIRTNGRSKTLPNGVNKADFRIVVAVNDGISGSVSQEFTISVVRDTPVTQPPTTNPPTTPPPTEEIPAEETNQPAKIEILYPTDNSILKGDNNVVRWDITEPDGLKKITLEYSKSPDKDWQIISSLESPLHLASSTYFWDVSNIEDDTYYLRITVTDNKGAEVNRVSDSFLIKNKEDETQSQPLIINLSPDSNSEVKDNRPKISAEFVPSGTSKVDITTIKIILNDVDITNKCTTSETGFTCELDQTLEEGKHSVNVNYKDTDGKIAGLNWTFTVNTKGDEQTLTQENIIILGREIPRNSLFILISICCIFGILIIIPWILYKNWKKNQTKPATTFGDYTPLPPGTMPIDPFAKVEQPSAPIPFQQTQDQNEIEQSLQNYWQEQGRPLETQYPAPIPYQPTRVAPPVVTPQIPVTPTQQEIQATQPEVQEIPKEQVPLEGAAVEPFQEIQPITEVPPQEQPAPPQQQPPAPQDGTVPPSLPEDIDFFEPTPIDNNGNNGNKE